MNPSRPRPSYVGTDPKVKGDTPETVKRIYRTLLADYRKVMRDRHADTSVTIKVEHRLSKVWFYGEKAWGWTARLSLAAKGYKPRTVTLQIPPDYSRERSTIY